MKSGSSPDAKWEGCHTLQLCSVRMDGWEDVRHNSVGRGKAELFTPDGKRSSGIWAGTLLFVPLWTYISPETRISMQEERPKCIEEHLRMVNCMNIQIQTMPELLSRHVCYFSWLEICTHYSWCWKTLLWVYMVKSLLIYLSGLGWSWWGIARTPRTTRTHRTHRTICSFQRISEYLGFSVSELCLP